MATQQTRPELAPCDYCAGDGDPEQCQYAEPIREIGGKCTCYSLKGCLVECGCDQAAYWATICSDYWANNSWDIEDGASENQDTIRLAVTS